MVKAADEAQPDSPGAFGVGCFLLSSAPAQAPEFIFFLVRGTRTTMCGSFEQFDEQLRANQTNSSIALHRNQKQMIHIIISRMRRMQQNMYHNKKIIGIEVIVKLNY